MNLDSTRQREILGLVLLALAGLTFLSLFSFTHGAVSDLWVDLLNRLFGWGAYLVALLLAGLGVTALAGSLRDGWQVPWHRVVSGEVLFMVLLALLHILALPDDPYALATRGKGGGLVGWGLSSVLVQVATRPGAIVFLLVVGLLSFLVTLDVSAREVQARLEGLFQLGRSAEVAGLEEEALAVEESAPANEEPAEPEPAPAPAAKVLERKKRRRKSRRRTRAKSESRLPPLDLLDPESPQAYKDAEVRRRAKIIEETLASFGVPASVVETNVGPTITQFGVKPGYIEKEKSGGEVERRKVKVRKITSLQKDLALALSASPVRIEAPVPGRPLVGIEVPNSEIVVVSLRGVMASDRFQVMESNLALGLGRNVSGNPVVADLATMPHLLISGATGSGKSVCINAMLACLLCRNSPEDLQLVLVDPKRVELTNLNGLPHLIDSVMTDVDKVVDALKWVTQEMDRRFDIFAERGVRDIEGYNALPSSRREEHLPYILVVIDELADLMMVSPDQVERLVCRIAQMARATGIHLVMATQRPSVDVVTGLIKANFPARISFAVTSGVDSRVILDSTGAEDLLGQGDMLYMASDSSQLVRLQGSYVSGEEMNRIVRFWKERYVDDLEAMEDQEPPWADIAQQEAREGDDLLPDAIDVVTQHEYASTSFLQRQLRIGYPRAARIMDQLEQMGVVGPPESAGRSREVLAEPEESWDE